MRDTNVSGHASPSGVRFRLAEEEWTPLDLGVGGEVASTSLLIGDERAGPVFMMFAVPPGIAVPTGPAHGHASDSWRISLRGTVPVGPRNYAFGEFRIQEGWSPYGPDSFASGPDGGWLTIMFADRRGTRVRPVRASDEATGNESNAGLATFLGLDHGDLLDPDDSSGPAAVAATEGTVQKVAHCDGSFSDVESWSRVGHSRYVAALMGEPTVGPVVVFVSTAKNEVAAPSCTFGTDTLTFVVGGTCTMGDTEYVTGDAVLQPRGVASRPSVAGPDGVQQIVVIGDRRYSKPDIHGSGGWPPIIEGVVRGLQMKLSIPAAKAI